MLSMLALCLSFLFIEYTQDLCDQRYAALEAAKYALWDYLPTYDNKMEDVNNQIEGCRGRCQIIANDHHNTDGLTMLSNIERARDNVYNGAVAQAETSSQMGYARRHEGDMWYDRQEWKIAYRWYQESQESYETAKVQYQDAVNELVDVQIMLNDLENWIEQFSNLP